MMSTAKWDQAVASIRIVPHSAVVDETVVLMDEPAEGAAEEIPAAEPMAVLRPTTELPAMLEDMAEAVHSAPHDPGGNPAAVAVLRVCALVLGSAQAARYRGEWANELHEMRGEGASRRARARYVLAAVWSLPALAVECRLKRKRAAE